MSSAIAPRPLPRPGGAGGDTLKVALYPDEPTQVSRLLALAASAGSGETCRGQLRIVEAEEGNNLFFLEKDLSGNTFRGMLVCARYREGHVVEPHAVQMIPKVPRATGAEPSSTCRLFMTSQSIPANAVSVSNVALLYLGKGVIMTTATFRRLSSGGLWSCGAFRTQGGKWVTEADAGFKQGGDVTAKLAIGTLVNLFAVNDPKVWFSRSRKALGHFQELKYPTDSGGVRSDRLYPSVCGLSPPCPVPDYRTHLQPFWLFDSDVYFPLTLPCLFITLLPVAVEACMKAPAEAPSEVPLATLTHRRWY